MDLKKERKESVLIRQELNVVNALGLHKRPAAKFVRAAHGFRSEIWIDKGQARFSAISIIDVLTADLNCGDTAMIEARGPDAKEAVARLVNLVREFKQRDLNGQWPICAEDDF